MEWKPADDGLDVKSTASENEWAVVDTVAYNKHDKHEGRLSNLYMMYDIL